MATLTVLRFPTADGVDAALAGLRDLQEEHALTLRDAAIVSWPAGTAGPSTHALDSVTTTGALGGVFWGRLFGLIFFSPLFGMTVGIATGALGGVFRDYGIDEIFVCAVRSAVTEGTSALFLMTRETVVDTVVDGMKHVPIAVIATNLSRERERRLREVLVHC